MKFASLSESFKSLCNLVNSDNVKNFKWYGILLRLGNQIISALSQNQITLNGKKLQLMKKKLMEICYQYASDDAEFYAMSVALECIIMILLILIC